MNKLKPVVHSVFVVTSIFSMFIFYGCGAQSLGPHEPLLPVIDSEEKFADRYQLDEAAQNYYDLFGKGVVEGSEISTYSNQKEFNQKGQLIAAWSGQLDSIRFTSQWTGASWLRKLYSVDILNLLSAITCALNLIACFQIDILSIKLSLMDCGVISL